MNAAFRGQTWAPSRAQLRLGARPATALVVVRALAVILAIALTPGVAEAAEDFAHYVAEGHTLHAPTAEAAHADHDQHEREHGDDEHGCSTLFHLCACHSPTPSVTSLWHTIEQTTALESTLTGVLAQRARRPADGFEDESLRPPIA